MIKSLSRTAGKLEPDPKELAAREAKKAAKKAKKKAAEAAEVAPPAAAVAPPAPVVVPEPEPAPVPVVEEAVEPAAEPAPKIEYPVKTKRPRYVRPVVERKAPPKPLPPLARSNSLTAKLLSKVVPPLPPPDAVTASGIPGRR